MRPRTISALLACAIGVVALAPQAGAHSTGTPAQIAWVRRAAGNFVSAELQRDGAAACGILNAPLRATVHGRSCASRWDSRLASMLRDPAARAALRADRRDVSSATVHVAGNHATIDLPHPLYEGDSSLVWTEMCWMVER